MKNVVVTESIHADGRRMLDERDDLKVTYLNGDRSLLPDALKTAHAIIVRMFELGEAQLSNAPDLEIVCRHGVGCDNIAVDYLSSRKIPVAIAVDSNTTSVVEHTLMMMLALNKQAVYYNDIMHNDRWSDRGKCPTSELAGKHVVIVGFGRIGKKVARVCKAFDMRVTVTDIKLDRELATALGCDAVEDFHPLLPAADYLSVHVPLDESTHHMIGAAELSALPSHAIVINCARGGIVDEVALASALAAGDIAHAGADVYSIEPPGPENPLTKSPNTLLTPHWAAGTNESLSRMATYSVRNVLDQFANNLSPEFIFNAAELVKD